MIFPTGAPSAVMYVWKGSASSDVEFSTAQKIAETLKGSRAVELVTESEEPDAFWEALGGKAEYAHHKNMPEIAREPQLFHCTTSKGFFDIQPLYDFSQADLEEADVYLLDTFTSIYVWIGKEATEQEKKQTLEASSMYISKVGYSDDTPVVQVHSGSEPIMFTCNFVGWDAEKMKGYVDPYEARLSEALAQQEAEEKAAEEEEAKARAAAEAKRKEEEAAAAAAEAKRKEEEAAAAAAAAAEEESKKASSKSKFKSPMEYSLPYEELKKADVPEGVDPTKKEQYLSDTDFEKILGSPRGVFNQMKTWKQQQLKRAAGLF